MKTFRLIFFVIILLISVVFTGCGRNQTPSDKQSRLIAAENIELKQHIEELNLQIEQLKEQHLKEMESLKENATQDVLDAVIQQNVELRQEIERLTKQLESQ